MPKLDRQHARVAGEGLGHAQAHPRGVTWHTAADGLSSGREWPTSCSLPAVAARAKEDEAQKKSRRGARSPGRSRESRMRIRSTWPTFISDGSSLRIGCNICCQECQKLCAALSTAPRFHPWVLPRLQLQQGAHSCSPTRVRRGEKGGCTCSGQNLSYKLNVLWAGDKGRQRGAISTTTVD